MKKNPLVSNKSKNYPSQIKELIAFEKDLLDIVKSIKFRNISNKLKNLMKADIVEVKGLPNVFIPVDKQQICMTFTNRVQKIIKGQYH